MKGHIIFIFLPNLAGKACRAMVTMTVPVLAPVEAEADEQDAVDRQQDSPRDHTHRQQPAEGATVLKGFFNARVLIAAWRSNLNLCLRHCIFFI
jgi:hypothetical protein